MAASKPTVTPPLSHVSRGKCCSAWRFGRRPILSRACCGLLASTGRGLTSVRCPALRRPWPSTSRIADRRARCICGSLSEHCCARPCRAVDSTGIKVEGEGAWLARKYGGSKWWGWRKIHIGIDEEALEIRAVPCRQAICAANLPRGEITGSDIGDGPVLPDLLSQISIGEEIGSVIADGLRHPQVPRCHRGSRRLCYHAAPQERQALADRHRRCFRAKRDPASLQLSRPRPVATTKRISPQKPGRDEDALCEVASWYGTSTARSRRFRSVSPCSTATQRSAYPSRKP